MRKILLLMAIMIIMTVTYPAKHLEDYVICEEGPVTENNYISFYVDGYVLIEGTETVKSGIGYEIIAPLSSASRVRKQIPRIMGESIVIRGGTEDAEKYLNRMNASVINTVTVDGTVFIQAYTRYFRYYAETDRCRVNVQIAVIPDGKIIIGTPVILGSC